MLHYSDFIFILNRNNVWIYKYVVLQNQVDSFYGNIFVYNFIIEENLGIFPQFLILLFFSVNLIMVVYFQLDGLQTYKTSSYDCY